MRLEAFMDTNGLRPWLPLLGGELEKPYFQELSRRVGAARQEGPVYPPEEEVFRAFSLTPPERVRVVMLGQDPYHGPGQANGLAFSVRAGIPLPPSLRNIYRELSEDLGCAPPPDGDLTRWAEQGVLLLNAVLTVAEGRPGSHRGWGWERFTDTAAAALAALSQPIVFVLWGAQAQKKADAAAASPYPRLVLQAPHPSPLSAYRGFFGSRPFSQVRDFLRAHGEKPPQFT